MTIIAKRVLESITHTFADANAIPRHLFHLGPTMGRNVQNQMQSGESATTDVTMEDTSMHDDVLQSARATDQKSSVPPHSDFDKIFPRYMDPVYRFLYSRVGNREDAEDLTSMVFLNASRQLNAEEPQSSRAQWLFTVAHTVLADHWRRYFRAQAVLPLDDQSIEGVGPRDGDLPSTAIAQQVRDFLDALPIRYRTVLRLRFLRGYSILEAALEMDVTPETAKVMQHRALTKAVQASGGKL